MYPICIMFQYNIGAATLLDNIKWDFVNFCFSIIYRLIIPNWHMAKMYDRLSFLRDS